MESSTSSSAALNGPRGIAIGNASTIMDPRFLVPEEHRVGRNENEEAFSLDDDDADVNKRVPIIDMSELETADATTSSMINKLFADQRLDEGAGDDRGSTARSEISDQRLDQGVGDDRRSTTSSMINKRIGDACREWGFFQIINHGVPDDLVEQMMRVEKEFFDLPLEEKQRIRRTSTNSRGYSNDELTKQTQDWKECFDFGPKAFADLEEDHPSNRTQDGYNQWPSNPPQFKSVLTRYFNAMENLSARLMDAIAQALGLVPNYFHPFFGKKHSSLMRLNYYPVCPDPTAVFGVNRHTDAGAITIVAQDDVGGLQVFNNGKWVGVRPIKNAFVINIGDMVQVWTNGRYQAPLHRVLANKQSKRYSAPFFYNPSYETDCMPIAIPACMGEGEKEKQERRPIYRPINWGEYRGKRFEGDYADKGEEVQISHYIIKD